MAIDEEVFELKLLKLFLLKMAPVSIDQVSFNLGLRNFGLALRGFEDAT